MCSFNELKRCHLPQIVSDEGALGAMYEGVEESIPSAKAH
jgi:hypothetical protein